MKVKALNEVYALKAGLSVALVASGSSSSCSTCSCGGCSSSTCSSSSCG